MLEVFNNLFMSIAEQMGLRLQNTASSVNIKERLDFSCALFDADGQPDRQCAAYAGASGIDERKSSRPSCARTRARWSPATFRAERPVCRRHAPAGCDGRDARVRRGWPRGAVLRRLARPPCGHRRRHPRLDAAALAQRSTKKASCSTTSSSWTGAPGHCRRRRCGRCSPERSIRRATPTRISPTCAHRSPPTRRAWRKSCRWSTQFGLDVVQAYMRHVQDNAEEVGAPRDHCTARRQLRISRSTTARVSKSRSAWIASGAKRPIDFTGTSPQQTEQLQCAGARSRSPRCCMCSARS